MQIDFDIDVLMESVQSAAKRRGHFVAYVPMYEKWCVTSFGGRIVGGDEHLDRIYDVLDLLPIIIPPRPGAASGGRDSEVVAHEGVSSSLAGLGWSRIRRHVCERTWNRCHASMRQ